MSRLSLRQLKPCVLAVCAVLSMPSMANDTAKNNVSHAYAKNLETLFNQSPSQSVKQDFINAMTNHLSSERHVLGVYRAQTLPLTDKNSIDYGATPLWQTAIKTLQYHNQKNQQQKQTPLITIDDYLYVDESLALLPYLRFDDELNDFIPNGTVSREVGMSDEYQAKAVAVQEHISTLRECVIEQSVAIDELVRANPTINVNHKDIKHAQAVIADCHKQYENTIKYSDLKTDYEQNLGYLGSDLQNYGACVATYQWGLKDALAVNRAIKSYDEANYPLYDSVFLNHHVCHRAIVDRQDFEPWIYITEQSSWQELSDWVKQHQCADTHSVRHAVLRAEGKNYRQNIQDFYQNYQDYSTCLSEISPMVEMADDTPSTPLNKAKSWYDSYREMILSNHQGVADVATLPAFAGMAQLTSQLQSTPEQIAVQNRYINDHAITTMLGYSSPTSKQGKYIYSFDLHSPTMHQSVQLPIMYDFEQATIKADVSAVLPIVALAKPEHALSAKALPNQEMTFALPEHIRTLVPMALLYESFNKGMIKAFESLDDDQLTAIDISQDKFAKDIGAVRAIKIHMGSQESGQFLGVLLKQLSQDLRQHVLAHPEHYQNDKGEKINALLHELAIINQGYHSKDVGSLMQMVMAILPLDIRHASQIYLNRQGKIVGIQGSTLIFDANQNAKIHSVGQIRYANKPFAHPLNDKLQQSFTTKDSFDGVAWLKNMNESALAEEAKALRDGYLKEQLDLEDFDEHKENHSHEH